MYLAKYPSYRKTTFILWCKYFTIRINIYKKRGWKYRRDRRKPKNIWSMI